MAYDLARAPVQVTRSKTYQDYLDEDRGRVPEHFRVQGDDDGGADPPPVEHYASRAFYDRERSMWDKVWQMACREEHIPEVGDYHVYEVAKRSYLVVRTASGAIKAYPNACLHRGRKLRTESGHASSFRCPFHGFTWNLGGDLAHLPCQWDFPDRTPASLALREVKVGTWAGWVFINPDPNAMPLDDYLDPIKAQFAPYLWEQSWLGSHVAKVLRGNWKLVQEAFMESFHAIDTHPQIMGYIDDVGCQYDAWADKPHVNRMMVPFFAASPYVADQVSEQEIYDDFRGGARGEEAGGMQVGRLAAGQTARHKAADESRAAAQAATGVDLSTVSDAELIDGWYYNVFPNLMHWGGYGPNMWYRFRPWNDRHDMTLMEVGFVMRHPADAPKPPPAEMIMLDLDTPWASVAALGDLGGVLDQDTTNMAAVQEGLEATFAQTLVVSRYQEARLRQFHRTLRAYVAPGS
jgi:phenylpropionate dioxygenase-like ring-hydroxylating dioxygenase large terminal subunit